MDGLHHCIGHDDFPDVDACSSALIMGATAKKAHPLDYLLQHYPSSKGLYHHRVIDHSLLPGVGTHILPGQLLLGKAHIAPGQFQVPNH